MPPNVRSTIEGAWDGEPVQLYALADLNESMELDETWLGLGANKLCLVHSPKASDSSHMSHMSHSSHASHAVPQITTIDRAQIRKITDTPGLSCTTLTFLGENEEQPLARIRYTHRQRRAVENIRFVLQQQIEGQAVCPSGEPDEIYADSVAHAICEAQAAVAGKRLAVIWRLIAYLWPYRLQVAAGMAAAATMTLLSLIPPYLTGSLLDKVIKPFQSGQVNREQAMHAGWMLLLSLACVYAVREAFAWVRLRTMTVLGEYVARDLRHDIYEHLQKLSVSYFSAKQTGSIISRVSSDTDRIWDFIAFGVVEVSLSILMLIGLGGMLIWLDWPLGLVMTIPVPLFLLSIFRHGRWMNRLFLQAWRKWSNVTDVLSDTIPGIRIVKAFNQEEYEKRRFNSRNSDATNVFNSIRPGQKRVQVA